MGREAYLMRLALGRSALEPPEDSETFTAARAGDYTSALHAPGEIEASTSTNNQSPSPPRDTQLYDARGHPFNPWARSRSRKLREAQNDILSVIGVTERKIPVEETFGPDGVHYKLTSHEIDPDENEAGEFIGNAADLDYQFISWWIHALTNRLLVFPPKDGIPFPEILKLQWRALGWRDFTSAGLSPFMLGHIVSPELWTTNVLYFVDRAIISSISSRRWRNTYDSMRPFVAGGIEVALNIFVLPFRLHSMLQLLGFQPSSTWFGLPHPQSWVPLCGTSPLRFDGNALPILWFFLFRPLSSLVHQYMFMSLRPAIMGPLDEGHRRRSSSSRYAASVNAAPLLDLPTDPTVLTSAFQFIFGFLRWSPPTFPTHKRERLFHPGLRRRETWPPNHHHHQHHSIDANATQAGDIEEPAPEVAIEANAPNAGSTTPQSRPPPLTRIDTVATLDGFPTNDNPSDATIRVASINPATGEVDLEIGLPDDAFAEFTEDMFDGTSWESLEVSEILPMSEAEHARLSRRARHQNRDAELYIKPHHVSRLALEPTEFLASLANGWVSGWVLMPVRVWVLRGLVRCVLRSPEAFGVDAGRAAVLPSLLGGSAAGVLGFRQNWWAGEGVKHIVFASLLDVSMGLCYWLAEYAVVRYVGVGCFGWGKF